MFSTFNPSIFSSTTTTSITTSIVQNKWMVIGVILVLIVLAYIGYVVVKNASSSPNSTYSPDRENGISEANSNPPDVYLPLWYADWCPNCTATRPAWDAPTSKNDGKMITGPTVHYIEIDCSDDSQSGVQHSLNQYSIQGYPTIKLLDGPTPSGKLIANFDANPTEDAILQFLNTVV